MHSVHTKAQAFDSFVRRARSTWSNLGSVGESLFVERMDFSGRPIENIPRRVMAQARQIYVYCDAALDPKERDGGEFALRAFDRVFALYSDNGDLSYGLAFSLSPDGRIANATRDTYAHAFVLFACAAAYRLDGDPLHLRRADALDEFIQSKLVDHDHGGLWVGAPASSDGKFQNPLMHLLEAYLFLHRASGRDRYLEKAGAIARLFRERMFQHQFNVLPEQFASDWTPCAPNSPEATFEPGHHFEWVWLLDLYDMMSGEDHSDWRDRLWRTAREGGRDERGRCYDAVSWSMLPVRASIRLWPHAEGLKAACSMAAVRAPEALAMAADMLGAMLESFLDGPFLGGWIDHLDEAGRPLVDYAPCTSLYHLHLANTILQDLIEADR